MNIPAISRDKLFQMLPQGSARVVQGWIDRGDGVAVYRNVDLSSPDCGRLQFVSFGSPKAQLEVDDPPQTMPDMGTAINWRYQLESTYRDGHGTGDR